MFNDHNLSGFLGFAQCQFVHTLFQYDDLCWLYNEPGGSPRKGAIVYNQADGTV